MNVIMISLHKKNIKKLKEGDHLVFEKIFKHYYNALFFFAGKYIQDEDDAENLVQETFMSLWLNRKNILSDSESSIRSWLYNTLKNKCLNFLEKDLSRKKYNDYVRTRQMLNISVLKDFEIDDVLFHEVYEILNKALEQMPSQSKAVFEMSRLKGMKNKEIAETLGITVKAVEANMTRALKLLRSHFSDYLPLLISLLMDIC